MLDFSKTYLYRMTHIENISHILQFGITHKTSNNSNKNFKSIGDNSLINTRNNFKLKNASFFAATSTLMLSGDSSAIDRNPDRRKRLRTTWGAATFRHSDKGSGILELSFSVKTNFFDLKENFNRFLFKVQLYSVKEKMCFFINP